MRRTVLLLAIGIVVSACGGNTSNKTKTQTQPKDPEGMVRFEPTDEELYAACADLNGLGQYLIGKSTLKSLKADKEFRANNNSYNMDGTFYNGHWGHEFWEKKPHSVGIYDDYEESEYLEKKLKGKIRQIHGGYSYKIGGLEFDKFDMAFLNDTLVAIWFYPNDKDEKAVIDHFKEKYGNGRGKEYESKTSYSDTYTNRVDIEHVWENEKVLLKYTKDEYFTMKNGKSSGYFKKSMFIYSKNRYQAFEDILFGCIDNQIEAKEADKQKSLSTL